MKHACDNPKCEFHTISLSDNQVCFVTPDRVVHHRHRHSNGFYYCDACRVQVSLNRPCEVCGAPSTCESRDFRQILDGYKMRSEPFGEWHFYCSEHNPSPAVVK